MRNKDLKIAAIPSYFPPSEWKRFKAIEAHTAGEPFRVITSGFPPLKGSTIMAKRRYVQQNFDHWRRALMWEPRGHADMYGCLLTEPERSDSDLGVIFLHNEGYSTMCGHGIIALTKVVLEGGIIVKEGSQPCLKIDTPAGQVIARARREGERVVKVSFQNVPSFVVALDEKVNLPSVGLIHYDLAFGGAFYAFIRAEDLGLKLIPSEFKTIIEWGQRLKKLIASHPSLRHPISNDLSFLYGVIFIGPPQDPTHHSRNVCVFAEGEVDRSPTGTGVSARAAIHYTRGEIALHQDFTIESLINTCFTGRVIKNLQYGPYQAVIPEVEGEAFITGQSEFYLDPQDPLSTGFFLR
ncbi:MAG TPA: proline racemase [Candidatus Aminicenantes bacterium]|nr:proline racemase [Candidatus Aminicenantes bacterium]